GIGELVGDPTFRPVPPEMPDYGEEGVSLFVSHLRVEREHRPLELRLVEVVSRVAREPEPGAVEPHRSRVPRVNVVSLVEFAHVLLVTVAMIHDHRGGRLIGEKALAEDGTTARLEDVDVEGPRRR